MNNIIKLSNINFAYSQDNEIFNDAHLNIEQGERLCIIGENGTGKSTFLKILANIIPCKIEIDFFEIANTSIHNIIKHIGYIPDKPFLYDELTGVENISFIMNVFHENKKIYMENVVELCSKFNLSNDLNKKTKDYSLGMKHKLFLSCILARDIRLLLLDEPLTALDSYSQKIAIDEIIKKSNKGICTIFTSHIKELQSSLSTKSYQIKNKKFVYLD